MNEENKWTYIKARKDYIKECEKPSCCNCEFSTVESYTTLGG